MESLKNYVNSGIAYKNFSEEVIILSGTKVGKNYAKYSVKNKNGVTFYNVPGDVDLKDRAVMGFVNGDRSRPVLIGRGAKATINTSSFTIPVKVRLDWTDNSNDETGFKIERNVNSAGWSQLTTVGANITTYTDTDIQATNTYQYRVRAYNADGDSAYSNVVTVNF